MKFNVQPDGAVTYTTCDGDMVDLIAYRYYGAHETTPVVYRANPDLAFMPEVLPAGVVIVMPAYTPPPQVTRQTNLWD